MANIKLKDRSGAEQTYSNVNSVTIPNATGSGSTTFVLGGGLTPISAPSITLSGDSINWSAVTNAVSYMIYAGSDIIGYTTELTANLSALLGTEGKSAGTYSVTVRAIANGVTYGTSAASNSVSYTYAGYPVKGQIINLNLDGTSRQFRVLKISGSVAEVFSMYNVNDSVAFASSGNTYENGTLDNYLNTTWYNTLSATAKAAIVDKTFRQDSWYWGTDGNPDYNGVYINNGTDTNYQVSLGNASFGSQITRHVYALSVQDVIDYLGVTTEMITADTTLTYNNVWTMFWNDTSAHSNVYLWLRSANASGSNRAWYVDGRIGNVYYCSATSTDAARAAFQIDLSKIAYS